MIIRKLFEKHASAAGLGEEKLTRATIGLGTAIEAYLAVTKEKSTVGELLKIVNDPQNVYTLTPQNTMKYVEFMHKVGTIKVNPASWKEMFFPNVHHLPGS